MIWRGLMITIVLLLFWQCLVNVTHLPPYILPSPYQVGVSFYQHFNLLMSQSVPTLIETILGLMGAIILGCATAMSMAYIQSLRHWLRPVLLISQALPTFAIAPLLVIWFGYGMSSKIMTTILMLYFPIASAFFDGLSRTESSWLDLAQVMHASRWRTLWFIRVPAAIPALISGLRVSIAAAPIGAVIGEWVGASKGLGFLMLYANARMQIDLMFAALFTLIVWSLLLYFGVDAFLKQFVNWQREGI